MLRWVFLDIGNVLMNDDPAMALLYRELHRAMCLNGYRLSFHDLLGEREELIRTQGTEHWGILGRKYLGEDGHWSLMRRCASLIRADYMVCHDLIPGMAEAVRGLSERYRVGVIANQLKEVIDALEEIGLGRFISVRAISEVVGVRKPDIALFRWAIDRAECEPFEAVMVGDRIDNDIAPARSIGMWTILFRMPHGEKGYVPTGETERLYFDSQLRESISRIPPSGPEEAPDATAHDVPSLLAAIEQIRQRSVSPSEKPPARR